MMKENMSNYRCGMKRNLYNMQSRENQDIANLIRNKRIEENISLTDLAMGLMSASQLMKIEKGERPLEKNVRDRFLERLGMAKELYENLSDNHAYEDWKFRKKILIAIRDKKNVEAGCLIAEYEKHLQENDKVNRQFLLVMRAELCRQEGGSKEVIKKYYQSAVQLTVPEVENIWIRKRPLSVLEINLLLETIFYENEVDFFHKSIILKDYVGTGFYDEITKAKIYPKIVFYYLKRQLLLKNYWKEQHYVANLQLCDQAIEVLRDAGRIYYLVEILEIKIDILRGIPNGSKEFKAKIMADIEETDCLLGIIKKLYVDYDVPVYMEDCTYLYQQNWVFRISDILRIRREMFEMTQEQVCEGICSVKSLRRAEKGQTDMQMETLQKLMNRLGLPGQMQWSRVITSDPKVIRMIEESVRNQNNRDFLLTRKQLEKVKMDISLHIPQNKQYIMEKEAVLDFNEGKISKEEFLRREKEALECTLHVKDLLSKKKVYLTEREVICIRNGWKGMELNMKRQYIHFLLDLYFNIAQDNDLTDVISGYEFVIQGAADELGNMGEHEWAIEIDRKSMKDSLFCRRMWGIDYKLYDILWNKNQILKEQGQNIDEKEMTEGLQNCITISHYLKRNYFEEFFKNKLITC